MKKCIGIISYLPQKYSIRIERLVRLQSLLDTLNKLFNLPIIIIAQNYKDSEIDKLNSYYNNLILIRKNKLGITGAREMLRQEFINSEYDVIILIDDDGKIKGTSAESYLKQIDEHPGKIYEASKSLHKLMAVSKEVYKLQAYDLENTPENKLAYEDRLYFWTLVGNHPELLYKFINTGLCDISVANHDKYSSWSQGLSSDKIKEMSDRTDRLIEERTGKTKAEVYAIAGYSI